MGWATMDDVVDITGKESTQESLTLAQTMIELFAGTTVGADNDNAEELIGSKNWRRLKSAVAFQARWLDAHPDVLEAMDVEGVSQDGLSAQYADANAHLLAPMASRCLRRLTWFKEIRATRGNWSRRHVADRGPRDSAIGDDRYEWSSLPFGASPSQQQR